MKIEIVTAIAGIAGGGFAWLQSRINRLEDKKVSKDMFAQFEKNIDLRFDQMDDRMKELSLQGRDHTIALSKVIAKLEHKKK